MKTKYLRKALALIISCTAVMASAVCLAADENCNQGVVCNCTGLPVALYVTACYNIPAHKCYTGEEVDGECEWNLEFNGHVHEVVCIPFRKCLAGDKWVIVTTGEETPPDCDEICYPIVDYAHTWVINDCVIPEPVQGGN